MEFTFAEMFSGIGGFRLGLELNGWRCVWANDMDKYANKIYKKRFGNKELAEGDIKQIKADSVPRHTLLTAGFPCQAFSVAGKRKGFKDTRGTLFYHIIRVAKAKRPPLLLLENVKGLLSHDKGLTFQIIIESLEELGYLCEWQVLNSKHFGVPQNRERVFIIGHLRGTSTRQIFPIGANGEVPSGKGEGEPESREEASTLEASYGKSKSMNNMVVAGALSGGAHSGGLHSQMTYVLQEHSFSGKNGKGRGLRCFEGNVPALTKQMGTGGNNVPMVVANAVDCDGYLRSGKRPRDKDGKPQLLPIGYRRIRRLTPTECERLQGFPDGWTKGVSDTQRYKLLGNAVTVNVIEYLGMKLLDYT